MAGWAMNLHKIQTSWTMFEFTEPIVEGNLPKLMSAIVRIAWDCTPRLTVISHLENFLPKRRTHRQRAVDCCRSSTGFV